MYIFITNCVIFIAYKHHKDTYIEKKTNSYVYSFICKKKRKIGKKIGIIFLKETDGDPIKNEIKVGYD